LLTRWVGGGYGITGYGVSRPGIQNFAKKSTYSKEIIEF
jgi:hypothetical protein